MSILTPTFVGNLKTNAREVSIETYQSLTDNLWVDKVASTMTSVSKREILTISLQTASIDPLDSDLGGLIYEDAYRGMTEVENSGAGAGLSVKRTELEDLDGGIIGGLGMRTISSWAASVGEQAAYWPQRLVAEAMRNNALIGYDGKVLFATDHPLHPGDVARGVYANDFTGAASGSYPGALPIHEGAVTVEVALANLMKAKAYIGQIKQPNGRDPMRLRLEAMIVPPALEARAAQICGADFIAQSAASGALSGDIRPIRGRLGIGAPIVAEELASSFQNGSDTTYYLVCRRVSAVQMGGLVYVERQPFEMTYVGPETDEGLRAANELRWQTQGRNAVAVGCPFLIFRVRGS